MSVETQGLVASAARQMAEWLRHYDYAIANEAELCNIYFHHLTQQFLVNGLAPSRIRSEVKFLSRIGYRTRITASVDFGITSGNGHSPAFEAFIEAKAWIRPTHIPGLSPNSSTSKRHQCLGDARRLLGFQNAGQCTIVALLIFEQGSTHLRRLVPQELKSTGISCAEEWLDIGRAALGRRKEHLGLLWLEGRPNPAPAADG